MYIGKEVGSLQTGTYFGEMALLDDEVRKATVVATTPVDCFVPDRENFNRILGSLKDILARETTSRQKALDVVHADHNTSTVKNSANNKGTTSQYKFTDLVNIGVLGSGKFVIVTLAQHRYLCCSPV